MASLRDDKTKVLRHFLKSHKSFWHTLDSKTLACKHSQKNGYGICILSVTLLAQLSSCIHIIMITSSLVQYSPESTTSTVGLFPIVARSNTSPALYLNTNKIDSLFKGRSSLALRVDLQQYKYFFFAVMEPFERRSYE